MNDHELFKNKINDKFVVIHGHSCEKTKSMNISGYKNSCIQVSLFRPNLVNLPKILRGYMLFSYFCSLNV